MSSTRYDHSTNLLPHGPFRTAGCSVGPNALYFSHDDPRSDKARQEVKMGVYAAPVTYHPSSIIQTNNSTKILLVGGSFED